MNPGYGHDTVVVFDLDDTLYKEREYVFSGRRAVARYVSEKTGIPYDTLIEQMKAFGPTDPGAFDALIAHVGAERLSITEVLEVYRSHEPEIRLDAEADALLSRLKTEGIRMALVTDGRSVTQRMKIKALGLERFFDADSIFISSETGGDKTTPLSFEAVERRYRGASRRLYIGDNIAKDFRQPRLRGWTTVMLADPEGLNIFPQRLADVAPENRPDRVVFNIQDI